ncbi:flavin reductase family protein [Paenibacillus sonchi]|uniref:flavin reductase family protein n=1 Tax=Paenibacillus sonchi TaxID=373687 RepID=UPI0022B901FC|nr:flavin reductase family protein [Paenibacillus sonchi]MCE3204103.1 flavin reductase family protein [Paenibacillus sonchi]
MVVLVTSKHEDKHNIMAAGFHTTIGYAPLIYGVSLRKEAFSYDLIMNSGNFGINFVPVNYAELIQIVGTRTGREMDKFSEYNIEYDHGINLNVPILKEAYFAYEFKVIDSRNYGSHEFVAREVMTIYKDEDKFIEIDGWTMPDMNKLEVPLYLGRSVYATFNASSEQKDYV